VVPFRWRLPALSNFVLGPVFSSTFAPVAATGPNVRRSSSFLSGLGIRLPDRQEEVFAVQRTPWAASLVPASSACEIQFFLLPYGVDIAVVIPGYGWSLLKELGTVFFFLELEHPSRLIRPFPEQVGL